MEKFVGRKEKEEVILYYNLKNKRIKRMLMSYTYIFTLSFQTSYFTLIQYVL